MSTQTNATVLIVEDEKDLAEMYSQNLADEYDVRVAYDGEEALAAADETVDVVLLDRRMPGRSGDEVLAELRERGLGCRVVMVTAVDPDIELLDMAFDEYLVKPVAIEAVIDAVERMLARDAADERLRELFELASQTATLELKLDVGQLEESQQYQELLAELTDLPDEIELPDDEDDYYAEATIEKLQTLLDRIER